MKDLKIGLVGLGWAAGAHIDAFKAIEGVEVAAVCSRREWDESELQQKFGIPLKAYTDYEQMVADPDLDIIDICTPHPFHKKQIISAAKAGKHLVIEKPICLSFEDLKEIKSVIDETGISTCVCFECRFSAHFSLLKSMVDQGFLGEIHYGESDYYHGIGPWYGQFKWNIKKEIGGSSLLTAGCHALDGLLMFMGGKVSEVTGYETKSRSETFSPYEYPTTSVTLLKFEDGRIGKVTSSIDCMQPYYFHIQLTGSEGSIVDNRFYSSKMKGLSKERWSTLETSLIDSGDVSDHPYQAQFTEFIDSINQKRPMILTSFNEAFESHRVIFAAERSITENRPVKLSELD